MSQETDRLREIMALLRHPERGCPWDVEQTFTSIAPHTVEEAYEVLDAIETDDMGLLREELGDLLLQVVFHARMAEEQGLFDYEDVARAINDKLVRRHPHVFGDAVVRDAEHQLAAWEDLKAKERAEKAEHSTLDGIARGLPALLRALKLQKRAARVGFDWGDAQGALAKLREETIELTDELAAGTSADSTRIIDEMGDILFSCVNLARKLGVEPETALGRCNAKFERRFRRMEALLSAAGETPDKASLARLDALWDMAKAEEVRDRVPEEDSATA